MPELTDQQFAVFAEATDIERPLIMTNLPFGKLIDDIVHPYEADEPFFVDGAPLTKKKIRRIKILKQEPFLARGLAILHHDLRQSSDARKQEILGQQYHTRVEAILRESSEDVTSQILKAFNTAIRPRLKDYLPKKDELIKAALEVFVDQAKKLGGA